MTNAAVEPLLNAALHPAPTLPVCFTLSFMYNIIYTNEIKNTCNNISAKQFKNMK